MWAGCGFVEVAYQHQRRRRPPVACDVVGTVQAGLAGPERPVVDEDLEGGAALAEHVETTEVAFVQRHGRVIIAPVVQYQCGGVVEQGWAEVPDREPAGQADVAAAESCA